MTTKKFNPSEHLSAARKGGPNDYLQVKWRLVWLREEFPDAMIETDMYELDDKRCVVRAKVTLPNGGGAMGYGSETPSDFKDYIEKAETKAIGRALAALGYGTQFAPELDEGDRIVDSPTPRTTTPPRATQAPAKAPSGGAGEPAMKRMHAILAEKGLGHEHLHEYAKSLGHESSKEMTVDEMKKLADGLKDKPEAAIKYLVKLVQDAELQQINIDLNAQIDGGK